MVHHAFPTIILAELLSLPCNFKLNLVDLPRPQQPGTCPSKQEHATHEYLGGKVAGSRNHCGSEAVAGMYVNPRPQPNATPWLIKRCHISVAYEEPNRGTKSRRVPMKRVILIPRYLWEKSTAGAHRRAWEIDSPPIKAYSSCDAFLKVEFSR